MQPTKKSQHQGKGESGLYHRELTNRKTLHGQLVDQIIAIGTQINTAILSYRSMVIYRILQS